MKLNTKIILTILQLALIPWILGGVIITLIVQENINSKTFVDLNNFANVQKHRLEDVIQNKQNLLDLFTKNPELVESLHSFEVHSTPSNKAAIQKHLIEWYAGEGNANLQKVFMATAEGTIVASTETPLIGKNISDEDYFKRGILHDNLSVLKKGSAGSVSHYLMGPVTTQGRVEGVVVVITNADDILSVSQDYTGLGETGESLLVMKNSEGNVLFLTPTRLDAGAALTRIVPATDTRVPSTQAILGKEAVFAQAIDYREVPVFAATRYLDSVGWGIVVKIDESEAQALSVTVGRLFAIMISIIGLMIILIGIIMSRHITGSISEMTKIANRISEGGLQQSLVTTSKDEIGALAVAFNHMTVKLQESYATLEEKVAQRTTDLAKKTQEAKDSEKAAFNIAADLKEEQEKLAEEKIKAEGLVNDLKKFKLAMDNTSDQVVITDVDGVVIYSNKAVKKITGYDPEETVGKKAGSLWGASMPIEYYQNFWHVIKDQKDTFIGEINNKRRNGELYTAMISVSPVLDDNGNILFFVGLERDISKEKEVDRAKSEFISLASHQMRTPLTAINWYSEMLLDGDAGKLTKKQQEYFKEVYSAGQQMNDIIKSFLHILRLETGTLTVNPLPTSVQEIIKIVLKEVQLDVDRKHLKVSMNYQDDIPLVKVDAELVRVVFQNFISNAVKYTSDKGEVTISLDKITKGGLAGGKMAEEDSVLVSVHDTGIGIPAADKDKIFAKFFRTDNAKRWDPNGNGLGLYMSRKMADFIGATLWFTSEVGKGTTFCVLLPVEWKRKV